MNCIALLFLFASCVYGASIPVVNPCVDSELYFLRYYQPYPLDERRYIQCDPWNNMEVRDCFAGSKWSSWLGRCSDGAFERQFGSMTLNETVSQEVPTVSPITVLPVSNASYCSYYGNDTCINGGICNFYPIGSRCACLGNYTGDYCQTRDVRSLGVFGKLINDSFSLEVYRKSRPLMDEFYVYNGTIDTSMVADELTRKYISEYLAFYPNGTMRFDMLVNYLIQDYLSLLYPWQFFLQEFGYQSEVQMGYVNAIPSLLLSSKYSYDRYFDIWTLYDDVLHKLIDYLPKYLPNIHKEAQLFYQIYDGIFREFERSGNFSAMMANYTSPFGNASYVTIEMIRDKIYRDFNETLGLSYSLFDLLGRFDEEIGVRAASVSTPSALNATYIQEVVANFSLSDNVTGLIAALSESNAEIWDSLSFYGFWTIVSEFVPDDILNTTRNSTLFLNGSAIARLVRPSRPNGVFRSNSFSDQVPVFQALVADDEDDEDMSWTPTTVADEPEKLVSGLNGTNAALVSDFNNTVVVPQHLVNATVEFLFGSSNESVVRPEKLISEWNQTVVRPESLVVFNQTFERLVNDSVVPQHLISEVNGTFGALEADNSTFAFLQSSNVTVGFLQSQNVSVPVPERLVGESNVTFVRPEHLITFNESIVPEKLVFLNETLPQHLVGSFNLSDVKPAQFVADFNTTSIRSEKFMAFNESTPVSAHLLNDPVDESFVERPVSDKLESVNGTIVLKLVV